MFNKNYDILNGAWEEKGVIGTRIEIAKNDIVVLWQNNPVLTTSFKTEKNGDALELKLKNNGLRYAGTYSDYAEVTSITFSDGKLEFCEYFPITGESKTVLTKTENSRYGNYEVADEILNELDGEWTDGNGYYELSFKNGEMNLNGEKHKVCVLKPKGAVQENISYTVTDIDPSVSGFGGLSRFNYENGILTANLLILDGPTVKVIFKKTDQ